MSVTWQEKIVHLDEIGRSELGQFAKSDTGFEVSEKIDGQNLSFGIDGDGRFFTKTKRSKPVYNAEFYDGIPYLSGFKNFHEDLAGQGAKYLREVWKDFRENEGSDTIQIFAELLPYAHTNTVKYDDSTMLENGAIVLFDFKVDGDRSAGLLPILQAFSDALSQELSTFACYHKPVIDIEPPMDVEKDPASLKAFLIEFLEDRYNPLLGADRPEGFVIRNKDTGQMVKLVDKDRFTEANKETHEVSNDVQSANRNLKVTVRQDVFDNADVLTNWDKTQEKVADELAVRKQRGKGGFDSMEEIIRVLIRDMDSEDHIKPMPRVSEIFDDALADYRETMEDVTTKFRERSGEDISQIARDVSRHKIQTSLEKTFETMQEFRGTGSLVPLVKLSLGPTRVGRLEDQFLDG